MIGRIIAATFQFRFMALSVNVIDRDDPSNIDSIPSGHWIGNSMTLTRSLCTFTTIMYCLCMENIRNGAHYQELCAM